MTLFSHFIPLHTMNQECITILSTSTDYWTHLPRHLVLRFTLPLKHDLQPSLPCSMCCCHGHTSTQCVWYSPGICSYCDEVGHTVHTCNILQRDQQRFNPHLLYCLTCRQLGHTLSYCNPLPSYQ